MTDRPSRSGRITTSTLGSAATKSLNLTSPAVWESLGTGSA